MTIWKLPDAPGSDTGQPPRRVWDNNGVGWASVSDDGSRWRNDLGTELTWHKLISLFGPISSDPERDYA